MLLSRKSRDRSRLASCRGRSVTSAVNVAVAAERTVVTDRSCPPEQRESQDLPAGTQPPDQSQRGWSAVSLSSISPNSPGPDVVPAQGSSESGRNRDTAVCHDAIALKVKILSSDADRWSVAILWSILRSDQSVIRRLQQRRLDRKHCSFEARCEPCRCSDSGLRSGEIAPNRRISHP